VHVASLASLVARSKPRADLGEGEVRNARRPPIGNPFQRPRNVGAGDAVDARGAERRQDIAQENPATFVDPGGAEGPGAFGVPIVGDLLEDRGAGGEPEHVRASPSSGWRAQLRVGEGGVPLLGDWGSRFQIAPLRPMKSISYLMM